MKLLRSALGALGAISVGLVIRNATKTLAEFAQEMSTVQAITRAGTEQFKELEAEARRLGATTRFSASQAAEGMTFLARAGFDANEVLGAIGPTLQLAQAGALELGRAADLASNVLTGFGIDATDASRVIDVMALAANSANTNVEQLGEAMSYVAPIARSLGVSLEETTAGVQVLSDAGIQASRAGTNLTMVMRKLEAPQNKQKQIMKELGLELEDVRVSEVGLTQALTNLKESGATTAQIFDLFGRSAAAAAVLIEGTEGKIQDFTGANEKAKGTAAEVARVMDDNLNGALLAVRSAWQELQLAFGDLGAEEGLTKFMKGLASVLRGTAANLEIVTKNMAALAVAIAAVKWAGFLKGISTSAGALALLNKGLVATQTAMKALAINPITVGLLALSAAVIAVNTAFDKFNQLQKEIEAIEERTYKMRLKRLQAQVREIQERKAANAALEAYIKKLEIENRFLGMSADAQEEMVSLDEAAAIAKRALTAEEEAQIRALLEQKNAIEAANKQREAEKAFLASVQEPMVKYKEELALLNSEYVQTALGATAAARALEELKKKYGIDQEDTKEDVFAKRLSALERESVLVGKTADERARLNATWALQDELVANEQSISKAELDRYLNLLQLNREEEKRQAVIENALGPERALKEEMRILNELIAEGGPNVQAYTERMEELRKQMDKTANDPAALKLKEFYKTAFDSAADSVIRFTQTGKLAVREMVADMLQQLAKLAAQKFFMQLAGGLGLPAFATGGSFVVGGEQGTDKNLVAFQASRGERVTITPPGGTPPAAAAPPVTAAAANVNIRVVNVLDPSLVTDALASDEGEQAILNVIQKNGTTVRQAVSA